MKLSLPPKLLTSPMIPFWLLHKIEKKIQKYLFQHIYIYVIFIYLFIYLFIYFSSIGLKGWELVPPFDRYLFFWPFGLITGPKSDDTLKYYILIWS